MKDLINKVERMTSIEIAEVTGKQHKNVMQAIRNMEPAWEKISGLKFQLSTYKRPYRSYITLLLTDQDRVSVQQISQI